MKTRSLLIEFDETWTPTVSINAETDEQEAKLREIADRMLENYKRPADHEN